MISNFFYFCPFLSQVKTYPQDFFDEDHDSRKNKRNNKKCGYLKYEAMGINEDGNKYADRLKAGMNDYIYPRNYIFFAQNTKVKYTHPTQKPVELFEYLIKTYTNENDLVLDNCIGSGTTAIACINLKRNWIGIEKEKKYVAIANEIIKDQTRQLTLSL